LTCCASAGRTYSSSRHLIIEQASTM
jgi:hypothetical protein